MYPIQLTAPMKADLTNYGFDDLATSTQVDELVTKEGTVFVVVNSVCGCA
ncbi:MAG: BrxA/BrxB family bacilliredoxin, partial [Chitinophagales bacterium]